MPSRVKEARDFTREVRTLLQDAEELVRALGPQQAEALAALRAVTRRIAASPPLRWVAGAGLAGALLGAWFAMRRA